MRAGGLSCFSPWRGRKATFLPSMRQFRLRGKDKLPEAARAIGVDVLERALELAPGTIKVYVLVEQIEACFQLMEIRAALGLHFVGFNTGRWDYINSVADALAWDDSFINPNIDAVTMTYGYMRAYEDRVRRAVNTPDAGGRCALWQGGMEPNIPVGSPAGVDASMRRAVAGAEREQQQEQKLAEPAALLDRWWGRDGLRRVFRLKFLLRA